MRGTLKRALNAVALVITLPAAMTCWAQEAVLPGVGMFMFWVHVAAQLPGAPGLFVRRAFYRWLLPHCSENVVIEFGVILNRRAEIASGAHVGNYALIGWARIGENALIGSRASIPSGGGQHVFLPEGTWSAVDSALLKKVVIGANTWIGEGAIVMADVGQQCMVAAGSVVASPLPDGVMVAGNPARFVRRVVAQAGGSPDDTPVSFVR